MLAGSCESPDAVVEGEPAAFYELIVNRDPCGVTVSGDRAAVDRLLDTLPEHTQPGPVASAA